jgi:hypothetical protein
MFFCKCRHFVALTSEYVAAYGSGWLAPRDSGFVVRTTCPTFSWVVFFRVREHEGSMITVEVINRRLKRDGECWSLGSKSVQRARVSHASSYLACFWGVRLRRERRRGSFGPSPARSVLHHLPFTVGRGPPSLYSQRSWRL